jgi:hypothetical protein
MNKKYVTIFSALVAVTVLTFSCYFGFANPRSTDEVKDVSIKFNENLLSKDQLLSLSDYVVKGKFTKFKEKKMNTSNQKMENGDSFDFTIPYNIYNLEVIENLKGTPKSKKIDVIFVGDKPDDINLNQEYILFLEKNTINKDKYVSLISYTQGFFEADTDTFSNKGLFEIDPSSQKWKNLKTNIILNEEDF